VSRIVKLASLLAAAEDTLHSSIHQMFHLATGAVPHTTLQRLPHAAALPASTAVSG
jgi:hypothetical protein